MTRRLSHTVLLRYVLLQIVGTMSNMIQRGSRSHFVTVQAILDQASFLASLNKNLIMSRAIKISFRRAVNARKRYAERNATANPGAIEEEDGHIHFIWILEESARILQPVVNVQNTAKSDRQESVLEDQYVSNTFQLLQVEDAEDDVDPEDEHMVTDDQSSDPTDLAPPSAQQEVYAPVIDKASDLQFRYSCEVEEAEKTLEHFRDVVVEYDNGKIHLASFAFIVDAAIELVGHNEMQLLDEAAEDGHELSLRVAEDSNLFLPYITVSDLSTMGPVIPLLSKRHPSIDDVAMKEADRHLVQYTMDVLRKQVRLSPYSCYHY